MRVCSSVGLSVRPSVVVVVVFTGAYTGRVEPEVGIHGFGVVRVFAEER